MLSKNCKNVYLSKPIKTNIDGVPDTNWNWYKNPNREDGTFILNMQQNINELDINASGEYDFEIQKAITKEKYNIEKGDGISLEDISSSLNFVPDYKVKNKVTVGRTTLYILEKVNKSES